MEIFYTAWNWIKANVLISVLILLAVVVVFFPKLLSGLFGSPRRRRRSLPRSVGIRRRRRSLPRSVGIRRRNRPAIRGKNGRVKKPWQIKGSKAARIRMAKIRRLR